MRRQILGAITILLALSIVSPLWAQRDVPSGASDAGRGVSTGSSSSPSSTPAYTSVSSTSSYSSSGSYYSPSGGDLGNRGFSSTSVRVVPNLTGTCFKSASDYNYWQNYYDYLYSMYHIYPTYFTRFTRNYEPKVTPAMMKIALRDPLVLTREMLRAIDELEVMLADAQTGKAVEKNAIVAKSQEIRSFAKLIRQNQTIAVLDLSSKKAIDTGSDANALDSETIARLRAMAVDLDRQLVNLYSLPSSSTVSADSFRAPSFESQAKAIEKICKDIEHASRRL
jgi:hypothetical protein